MIGDAINLEAAVTPAAKSSVKKYRRERGITRKHNEQERIYCSLPNFGGSEQEHECKEQLYNLGV